MLFRSASIFLDKSLSKITDNENKKSTDENAFFFHINFSLNKVLALPV